MHTLTHSATSTLNHFTQTRGHAAVVPKRMARAVPMHANVQRNPQHSGVRRKPQAAQASLTAALAVPAAAQVAALNAARLVQDPAFRVILSAAGAFAGAVASDAWINETGSIAIMPMGAVLGAALGILLPRMITNPVLALGMCMAGILGGNMARRSLDGLPEDVREMSKIAAVGCAVGLGMLWP